MTSGVVLLAQEGHSTRIVHSVLNSTIGIDRVFLENAVPYRTLLRRRVKKLGAVRVVGQVLFRAAVVPTLTRIARPRISAILKEYGLTDSPIDESQIERVESVNMPLLIDRLRVLSPRVVIINGTRILSRELLDSVPATFINMHAGITPMYRGVHGAYWALAEGHPNLAGVTVHLVDPGIDTGSILSQAIIAPGPGDTYATYPYLQLAAGLPLLQQAVKEALAGTLTTKPAPSGQSRLRHHPTISQYIFNRLVHGTR